MNRVGALCGWLCAVLPLIAGAQERGRTDGPEGSEYGKGGYSRRGDSAFSLEIDWGAGVNPDGPIGDAPSGPPLYLGLTAAFWGSYWYQLEISGNYLFDGGRFSGLVGPKFRTPSYPVSFTLGMKAGALYTPNYGTRFALSPQIGADLLMGDERVILGLNYAPDIPVAGGSLDHRVYMNVGYRF